MTLNQLVWLVGVCSHLSAQASNKQRWLVGHSGWKWTESFTFDAFHLIELQAKFCFQQLFKIKMHDVIQFSEILEKCQEILTQKFICFPPKCNPRPKENERRIPRFTLYYKTQIQNITIHAYECCPQLKTAAHFLDFLFPHSLNLLPFYTHWHCSWDINEPSQRSFGIL